MSCGEIRLLYTSSRNSLTIGSHSKIYNRNVTNVSSDVKILVNGMFVLDRWSNAVIFM